MTRHRTLWAGIIAAILTLTTTLAGAAWTPQSVPSDQAQDRIITRTAIIRVGTTVYLHTNDTHGSVGLVAIQPYDCGVKLTWDGQPGEKILSATAEEDESISRLDIQSGYSGNVTTGVVYFYKNGAKVCSTSSAFGAYSNVWLTVTSLAPAA